MVRKALDAASEMEASGVFADAALGFKGPNGADITECKRILVGWFLQRGWVRAFERDLSVVVTGDSARAELEVVLARGNEVSRLEDVLPTNVAVRQAMSQ